MVDTLEIAGPWSRLPTIYREATRALVGVPHSRVATAHLSHSYADGACLYFTFAATPPPDEVERTYVALWDAGTTAVLAAGGNLSHHHGVGLNRSRFVGEALGGGHDVLARGQGRARSGRHPEPGQARPAQPLRSAGVALSEQLDLRALYEGGLVAAMLAVPAGVLGRILSDRSDDLGWLWVLVLVVLAGLVLGAGVAAWRQERGLPLTHGVITAVGVFVVVQTVGVVVQLLTGDSISWSRIASSLLLSLMAGMVGGLLGSFLLSHGGPPRR